MKASRRVFGPSSMRVEGIQALFLTGLVPEEGHLNQFFAWNLSFEFRCLGVEQGAWWV